MDLNQLLTLMAHQKGSDLFITVGRPPSIKIDGVIRPIGKSFLTPRQTRDILFSLMNEKQRGEFEETQECQFAIGAKGVGRFRVSAFVQRDSAAMVVRRIETRIPRIEELGLPSVLREVAMEKRGMVIFVGATGTGKSSSLAALIGYRNRQGTGHIITIEDPIEFIHNHEGCIVTQREVGVDTESFEVALKNALRQAPDVILIGEIRSRETMEQAVLFAETGHLVLATLHANNANQALDRMIGFFPEEARNQLFMDLSLNLKAVVAQQLVPRRSGKGRCAAVEVLINTPLAADMIRKGEVHKLKDLMKKSREQGMVTFDQALHELCKRGEISYKDALSSADSPNEVRLMIKLENSGAQQDSMEKRLVGMTLQEKDE